MSKSRRPLASGISWGQEAWGCTILQHCAPHLSTYASPNTHLCRLAVLERVALRRQVGLGGLQAAVLLNINLSYV